MWLRFSSFALASPQLRPSHALGLGETGATLRSARAGGFAAVKAATCLSGDDLVGTCAAGTGLCPAGRRFIGTKGFASVIKALGMHPIADLAIANWTGLFCNLDEDALSPGRNADRGEGVRGSVGAPRPDSAAFWFFLSVVPLLANSQKLRFSQVVSKAPRTRARYTCSAWPKRSRGLRRS